ncbi:MAG TPA: hypothetical protein PKC13_22300 [Blastocatellia bacterium]|nr:hypothetical protein [Blastocatellia bacterium]
MRTVVTGFAVLDLICQLNSICVEETVRAVKTSPPEDGKGVGVGVGSGFGVGVGVGSGVGVAAGVGVGVGVGKGPDPPDVPTVTVLDGVDISTPPPATVRT